MKMNSITVVLLFLLFSLVFVPIGRASELWIPSKVVLKSNDTIRGEISMLPSSGEFYNLGRKSSFEFRVSESDPVVEYTDEEVVRILVYYKESAPTIFEYVPVSKRRKKVFRLEFDGPVRIYSDLEPNQSSSPTYTQTSKGNSWDYSQFKAGSGYRVYYGIREGEEKVTLLNSEYVFSIPFKMRVKNYFKDCQQLLDKINSKGYFNKNRKRATLKKIAEDYSILCHTP